MADPKKVVETSGPLAGMSQPKLVALANQLGSANLHTLLDRRDEISAIKTDQLKSMIALGKATRASCGGIDCG
jgi:hypothetical protein